MAEDRQTSLACGDGYMALSCIELNDNKFIYFSIYIQRPYTHIKLFEMRLTPSKGGLGLILILTVIVNITFSAAQQPLNEGFFI